MFISHQIAGIGFFFSPNNKKRKYKNKNKENNEDLRNKTKTTIGTSHLV